MKIDTFNINIKYLYILKMEDTFTIIFEDNEFEFEKESIKQKSGMINSLIDFGTKTGEEICKYEIIDFEISVLVISKFMNYLNFEENQVVSNVEELFDMVNLCDFFLITDYKDFIIDNRSLIDLIDYDKWKSTSLNVRNICESVLYNLHVNITDIKPFIDVFTYLSKASHFQNDVTLDFLEDKIKAYETDEYKRIVAEITISGFEYYGRYTPIPQIDINIKNFLHNLKVLNSMKAESLQLIQDVSGITYFKINHENNVHLTFKVGNAKSHIIESDFPENYDFVIQLNNEVFLKRFPQRLIKYFKTFIIKKDENYDICKISLNNFENPSNIVNGRYVKIIEKNPINLFQYLDPGVYNMSNFNYETDFNISIFDIEYQGEIHDEPLKFASLIFDRLYLLLNHEGNINICFTDSYSKLFIEIELSNGTYVKCKFGY